MQMALSKNAVEFVKQTRIIVCALFVHELNG